MKQGKAVPEQVTVEAETWGETMKHEGTPVLTLSLRWPKLPDDRASFRRISRYYQQAADVWRKRWQTVLYPRACEAVSAAWERSRPFRPWEARGDYSVTYDQNGLLSLRLESYEYTGGAHGVTVLCGDVWDIASGTPRPLYSFFPSARRPKRFLLAEAAKQIETRVASGESLYYSDWARRLAADFSPERFYLTPDGKISFFYPLYTLAPYAEGIPTFTVPCPLLSSATRETAALPGSDV